MLPGFCPTENEKDSMNAWQTKMKFGGIGQKYLLE